MSAAFKVGGAILLAVVLFGILATALHSVLFYSMLALGVTAGLVFLGSLVFGRGERTLSSRTPHPRCGERVAQRELKRMERSINETTRRGPR